MPVEILVKIVLAGNSNSFLSCKNTPLNPRIYAKHENHCEYENNQYTIEKPNEIATTNAKKKFEIFQKLLVFRAILEKVVFSNLKPVNIFE